MEYSPLSAWLFVTLSNAVSVLCEDSRTEICQRFYVNQLPELIGDNFFEDFE